MKIESRDRDHDTWRTEANTAHFYGNCGHGGANTIDTPVGQEGDVILAFHALAQGERTVRAILSPEEAMTLEVALRHALGLVERVRRAASEEQTNT